MLYLADVTNNPWLFVRNPEWQASFDLDGNMAADTRKKMLDRAAADKMIVQGYHFPFPASGYIAKTAKGYDLDAGDVAAVAELIGLCRKKKAVREGGLLFCRATRSRRP